MNITLADMEVVCGIIQWNHCCSASDSAYCHTLQHSAVLLSVVHFVCHIWHMAQQTISVLIIQTSLNLH